MKKLAVSLSFIIVLFFASTALAGTCYYDGSGSSNGSGPIWYVRDSDHNTEAADSCKEDDVIYCISVASNDETVVLDSGNCTWNSGVTISGKKITLQGAGIGETLISGAAGTFFNVGISGSRITGFEIQFTSSNATGVYVQHTGWRVDHCKFDYRSASGKGIGVDYENRNRYYSSGYEIGGLVDNCEFYDCRVTVMGSAFARNAGAYAYHSVPLGLGQDSAVYVEDNYFNSTEFGNLIDTNRSGAYVFRYNTIVKTGDEGGFVVEAHSLQSENERGTKKWEVYRNDISHGGYGTMVLRGGTGTVFQNIVSVTGSGSKIVSIYNDRDLTESWKCDGSSPNWDSNEDGGWLCRDQTGAGSDQYAWSGTFPLPPQDKVPSYIWGNSVDLPVSIAGTNVQQNRDVFIDSDDGVRTGTLGNIPGTCTTGQAYWATDQGNWNEATSGDWVGQQGVLYKCTSTNTWTLNYTPYTYPYPLRGEEEPTLHGVTLHQDGTTLTLVFSENISQGSGYDDSDWDLDVSGGDSNIGIVYSSGDGTDTHVYTVSQGIRAGETVDIDFNGDADSMEDSEGNDLEAIDSDEVTNSSTQDPEITTCVISEDGVTLTIVFDENVTQGTGYDDSDWDLDISGGDSNVSVTYSSGDGTTSHVYTISQTIRSGQTVDIDFNGDSDSMESDGGVDLEAVDSDSVTNSSTQTTSIALTGTLSDGATEVEIQDVAGGETIILTLTNDTWDETVGADNEITTALIAGLDSAGSETYGWDAEVKGNLDYNDVTRDSATKVTIVLMPCSYEITENETITVTVPASALAISGSEVVASPTFEITAANPTVALTGTLTDGVDEGDVVTGGKTLIATISDATWHAGLGTDCEQTTAFINSFDSAQAEAAGWDAVVKAGLDYEDVTRNSDTVATITLPAFATYDISASETITGTISADCTSHTSAITATPTVVIVFFDTSTEEATGLAIQ